MYCQDVCGGHPLLSIRNIEKMTMSTFFYSEANKVRKE